MTKRTKRQQQAITNDTEAHDNIIEHELEDIQEEEKSIETTTTTTKQSKTRQKDDSNTNLKQMQQIQQLLTANKTTLTQCDKTEVLQRLKQIHTILQSYNTSNNNAESTKLQTTVLQTLAQQLLDRKLIQHKSDDITVYIGCILVDIMRISAPNNIFSTTELHVIFTLLFKQIKQISNTHSQYAVKYFYIFETLCQIHAFAVLIEANMIDEIIQLYEILLQLIDSNITTKTEFYILDTMANLINEFENNIPMKLIDLLLLQLTRQQRDKLIGENTHSKTTDLVIKLFHRCESSISRVLTQIMNEWFLYSSDNITQLHILKRTSRNTIDACESEITDFKQRIEILYELLAYCSDLLTTSISDLGDLIKTEDRDLRYEYIVMYLRLFTRQDILFARQNDLLLHSLIQRFNDKDASIRLIMLEYAPNLISVHPSHSTTILNTVLDHIQSGSEQIRLAAVECILKCAEYNIDTVQFEHLIAVGKRVLDTKKLVHNTAAEGLARLFDKYVSPSWRAGKSLPAQGKKLAWIPRRFMLSVATNELVIVLDTLLDHVMLGDKIPLNERITCLNAMYMAMQDNDVKQKFLTKIFKIKSETQKGIMKLFDVHRKHKLAANEAESTKLQRERTIIVNLLADYFVFAGENKHEFKDIIMDVLDCKDKNIYKFITKLCDITTEYSVIRSASSELLKAVRVSFGKSQKSNNNNDTKLTHDKVMNRIVITISMALFSIDAVKHQFDYISKQLELNREPIYKTAAEFLLQLAVLFPTMLQNSYGELYELLQRNDYLSDIAIQILALLQPSDEQPIPNEYSKSILKQLLQYARTGTITQTKYAVRAIHSLYTYQTSATGDLASHRIREICVDYIENMRLDNVEQLPAVFSGLSEIATHYPTLYESYNDDVIRPFIVRSLLNNTTDDGLDSATVQAIHCLVSYAKTFDLTQDTRASASGKHTLQILYRIIKYDGVFNRNDVNDRTQLSDERVQLLVACAEGMIELFTIPVYRAMILAPPSDAHTLHQHSDNGRLSAGNKIHQAHTSHVYGLCDMNLLIEHPHTTVRHAYRHKLIEKLLVSKKHIPYVHSHLLAFACNEESTERDKILKQLITLMLKARQHIQQREYALKSVQQKSDTRVMSTDQPEIWIFDFIYCLSYHPVTDESGIDPHNHQALSIVYDGICQYIDFFLDALLVGTDGANFGLISNILSTVKLYEDVRNPAKKTIYKITDLFGLCLRHRFEGKVWNTATNYSQQLVPAAAMYQLRKDGPYAQMTIHAKYKPPRQRVDEMNADKKKNPEAVAAREALTSPIKKTRKGSIVDEESIRSTHTSPNKTKKEHSKKVTPPSAIRKVQSRTAKDKGTKYAEHESSDIESDAGTDAESVNKENIHTKRKISNGTTTPAKRKKIVSESEMNETEVEVVPKRRSSTKSR